MLYCCSVSVIKEEHILEMKGSAKIEFSNLQSNCFAVVSWPLTSVRATQDNLQILHVETGDGGQHYLSIAGSTSAPSSRSRDDSTNTIKLNGKFASSLKLKNGEHVIFSTAEDSRSVSVTSAKVSCCSADDWEILETNATFVANNLLNQLRVVYSGQEFPFWLSRSMVVHLKIDEITPTGKFGILSANSEIVIPSLTTAAPFIPPNKLRSHQKLRVHVNSIPSFISLLPTETLLFSNPCHAFTYKSHLKLTSSSCNIEQESISVRISWDDDISQSQGTDNDGRPHSKGKSRCIKLFFLDRIESKVVKEFLPFVNIPCIYLHPEVIKETRRLVKSWVWVSATDEDVESLPRASDSRSSSSFHDEKSEQEPFLFIGRKTILEDCNSFATASLSLSCENFQHNLVGPEFGCMLIYGGSGYGKTSLAKATARFLAGPPYHVKWELVSCAKLRGKKPENLEKEMVRTLQNLSLHQPALLILDDFDVLATAASDATERSNQEEFLQLKTNETLLETLMKFKRSRIAVICTATNGETTNGYWQSRPGFHFFQNIVKIPSLSKLERLEIFTSCLNRYRIETGSDDFHSNHSGSNLIGRKTQDDELTTEIGLALSTIHEQNATPQFLVSVAKKWGAYLGSSIHTDNIRGHVPSSGGRDVVACAPSPQINNISKWNEDVNEQMKAFNEILKEEIRFSGDLAELMHGPDSMNKISWDSIGGLNGVKEELKKILEWPIKYPQFFKNAPVRLPCGILFYGYPGTGKSLMGLAVQTIVNVKFIHVKGPELLSKYIGASEQAVQDVFARVRESRPCILFFDEFDSLVPRRGHDSSGVTDRVVNQFLSEMDGIDGGLGEGVYLVAATSRPDLIDPAVLRPGRLDKHLFFNLPSQEERKGIFKAISSRVSLKLDDESDLDELSELTEGFTGADLNSLVFSAQLSVVNKYLGELDGNVSKSEEANPTAAAATINTQEIKVTKETLLSTLHDVKPSVEGKELRKFQAIYQGFMSSKSGAKELSSTVGTKLDEGENSWRMEAGKRATLA